MLSSDSYFVVVVAASKYINQKKTSKKNLWHPNSMEAQPAEWTTAAVSFAQVKFFFCWQEDSNSVLQIFYRKRPDILFYLLVSQFGYQE